MKRAYLGNRSFTQVLSFALPNFQAHSFARGVLLCCVLSLGTSGCYPTPGPDKAAIGGFLGSAWGAGAGAVIGNQLSSVGPGPGAAVGAGFGFASGLMTGIGLDVAEGAELQMQRELDALQVQVAANQRTLFTLQDALDARQRQLGFASAGGTIFFDEGRASLRSGTVVQLERIANAIKSNPYFGGVEIHAHSDDTGNAETNDRLAEARARTVATFLGTYGVSSDQIKTFAHGAGKPLASNSSPAGRQLNRRAEVVLVR